VSSVSRKIINTTILKIQNQAAMKWVAVTKHYTSQKLPISEPKKRQSSFRKNQNQRVAQYSFLHVVRSTCFGQKTTIIFNSTRTSDLNFQSLHRCTYVTK
jgi:alpha-acetolactate decarboxylase